jgi:lipoprotein-anchoring transpeptidase ErfK/SrfK
VRVACWILLVPILAAGCSGGGSGDRSAKRAPRAATVEQQKTTRQSQPAGHAVKPAKPAAVTKRAGKTAKTKPRRRQRALPWRLDGTSNVVHVRVRRIAVYRSPRAKQPMLRLRKRDPRGTQRAFLVRKTRGDWLQVFLPTRPNGSLGWVKRRAVKMYDNRYRLVVRLRSHKLQLWKKRHLLASYPVAVGTRSTPTPRGLYYIVELLKPRSPGGSYGPFSFGLSAHSNVLKQFAGGDGRVGLHGTNEPGLIGSDVSHGCIRLRNQPIRRLARILPLGTPVLVRS